MNGIGGLDAPLVIASPTVRGKLSRLRLIEIGESARRHIAMFELIPRDRLEQPPPHDLEALFGGCGTPGGLDASHHVSQPVEGLSAAYAAHLDVVRLRMWGPPRVRGRQR